MSTTPRAERFRALALGAGLAALLLVPTTVTLAGPSPQRTVRIRLATTGDPDGATVQPSISADARKVAFASQATNLISLDGNGEVSDVFVYDQGTSAISLVSAGPNGEPADGRSTEPVLTGDGAAVVFTSQAENLVLDDHNDEADVFLSLPDKGIVRVSVSTAGEEADGASSEPDISADGRYVVFTSKADNLVDNDTNDQEDVFIRDLTTGVTAMVSRGHDDRRAQGESSAPAISPDGRYVSFSSDAPNIAAGDGNHKQDVFMRDLQTGTTQRISKARGGGGQNRGMEGGFAAVSDVSRDGRYVAFESDATNLVGKDRNQRTDIFVRDTRKQSTRRVSLSTTNEEAGGASILPTITPDGHYVAFASRADDLVSKNTVGLDVFVRDITAKGGTVLVDVTSRGGPRSPELDTSVTPGRPSLSADASTAAFTSSASNLAGADKNEVADVFLRRLTPAASASADRRVLISDSDRLLIVFRSVDRAAGPLQCRLDYGPPTLCPLGGLLLPRLRPGSHVLSAYAGAPGSLYARRAIVIKMKIGKGKPRVQVQNPADDF